MEDVKRHQIKWQDESLVTKSQWKEIILSREITGVLDFKVILTVYNSPQNRTTATEIAKKLCQTSYHAIVNRNKSYSKRICNHLQM